MCFKKSSAGRIKNLKGMDLAIKAIKGVQLEAILPVEFQDAIRMLVLFTLLHRYNFLQEPDFLQETTFGRLCSESHCFGHYLTLMNRSENRKLCFCTEFWCQYNRSVKVAHYCLCFSITGVQFVVLSTIT